jgi:hypothetical protein
VQLKAGGSLQRMVLDLTIQPSARQHRQRDRKSDWCESNH